MKRTIFLTLLLTSLAGVRPLKPQVRHVRAGEMAVLLCPGCSQCSGDGAEPFWTSRAMSLTKTSSSLAEQRRKGVLLHGTSLIILRASEDHEGNYSCSFGGSNRQSWFRLTVHSELSKEFEAWNQYPLICYAQESCKLTCPDRNIPSVKTPNMSSSAIIWHKDGDPFQRDSYFSSVDEKDSGVYTCTRPYLYLGHTYNITFRVVLQVKPKKVFSVSRITQPQNNQVFYVDLGSPKVIDCKADLYSFFDDVFWLSNESFVEKNDSFPVFYNTTRVRGSGETRMTASLVFRKVSEEDLQTVYTCKLESDQQEPTFVTITLRKNVHLSSVRLASCIIGFLGLIIVTAFLCLKLKIHIALYLRDTLGCCRHAADGKTYDAYLMSYKSDADTALNEEDRKWLVNVLDEQFGYSLCLFNQNVVPEKEAVLDCVEQSRAVVLVPTSPESETGPDVLTDIHAALLKRGTRFILIDAKTTTIERPLPETLELLTKPGCRVTWRGNSSKLPSSSFCKQLRYHLPAPQHAPKLQHQRNTQDASC
ncbi:interleukin-18 receptor 1-like [Salarias fasciatus]|uniref:Interleukin-18 receptor 1-like n=1 Tax=Salarias fasciatus TaxID=181472 RepID=A0A672G052_SALFA|nr:interleukin-18 receptor 1-like [Salarias fasciatus]